MRTEMNVIVIYKESKYGEGKKVILEAGIKYYSSSSIPRSIP